MKQYGNRMIADAGKYLIASDNRRGYAIQMEDGVTFSEEPLTDTFILRPDGSVSYGGVFNIRPSDDMKARLIKKVYSNDDQIAIILNKDDSEERMEQFTQMQAWRKWAGETAQKILETAQMG